MVGCMLPIYRDNEAGFQHLDALVFGDQLLHEVKNLLPMPATAGFWLHDYPLFEHGFTPQQEKILTAARQGSAPLVQGGMLIIPVSSTTRIKVDIVIYDVDPDLLLKMAPEWLTRFQDTLHRHFLRIRQIYIDPATGLYNQRAINLLLAGTSSWHSLFLVATVSRSRSIAGGFRKIGQLSSLLEAVVSEPLFYFGQGVFGCVHQQTDRKAALDFSHRLITRLKREGLHRVHVGFSCLDGEDSGEKILHDCWLALLEAERRGPYSLCDASFLHNRDRQPFALPPAPVLRKLQHNWRGLDRFGLLLISLTGEGGEDIPELVSLLPADSRLVEFSSGRHFVLFPAASAAGTAKQVKALAERIAAHTGLQPGMGFCHWPSTGVTRVDCIRNCRKAIVHGSYYGEGAVVGFDFLSLNVSGDLYFDEGDYKQAIREYRAGLLMQPDDINLLNSLGVALAEVNRHREAVDCFSQVLSQDETDHMALVNKGMSCRLLGRNEQAVQCFEKAMLCPDHEKQSSLELYLQLGRLYCMTEQYESAVALLHRWQASKGPPEEFMFFRLMGEACMGALRNREAIENLQRSLQLHPGNSDSLSMLGLLYVLEGEGEEVGLSLCNRAVSMDEGDAEHFYRLASALYHLERNDEALAAVREAVRLRKNHDRAVLLRGRIYERLGLVRQAAQSYRRVGTLKTASAERKQTALARLHKLAEE